MRSLYIPIDPRQKEERTSAFYFTNCTDSLEHNSYALLSFKPSGIKDPFLGYDNSYRKFSFATQDIWENFKPIIFENNNFEKLPLDDDGQKAPKTTDNVLYINDIALVSYFLDTDVKIPSTSIITNIYKQLYLNSKVRYVLYKESGLSQNTAGLEAQVAQINELYNAIKMLHDDITAKHKNLEAKLDTVKTEIQSLKKNNSSSAIPPNIVGYLKKFYKTMELPPDNEMSNFVKSGIVTGTLLTKLYGHLEFDADYLKSSDGLKLCQYIKKQYEKNNNFKKLQDFYDNLASRAEFLASPTEKWAIRGYKIVSYGSLLFFPTQEEIDTIKSSFLPERIQKLQLLLEGEKE